MKHLLTAITCFLALSMSAQTPYNPDSDGDNLINITDMLDFLPLFGVEFYPEVNTSEPVIFETGFLSGTDTVFVPEEADIVFVQGIFGAFSHVQLPLDTTFKQISLVVEYPTSTGGYTTILGHWQGSYNYEAAYEWRNIAYCMRNRLGHWRCLED